MTKILKSKILFKFESKLKNKNKYIISATKQYFAYFVDLTDYGS